ncbi:MAG: metallophosphoesterase [Candidatus Paceibacterota bacterium]
MFRKRIVDLCVWMRRLILEKGIAFNDLVPGNLSIRNNRFTFFICISFVDAAICSDLLTDPILLSSCKDSIKVIWFTAGNGHNKLCWGENNVQVIAQSKKIPGWVTDSMVQVWRHEAGVKFSEFRKRENYYILSDQKILGPFYFKPLPSKDTPVKFLLTSDFQCRPRCAQTMTEARRFCEDIDAILHAGDFGPNVSAKYWLLHNCGVFNLIQGTAQVTIENKIFKGAAFTQKILLFPAYGNHDSVDGKQFPWERFNQIFFPEKGVSPPYYSMRFGNVFLIFLAVAKVPGEKYSYVSINETSPQYRWLVQELQLEACRNAKLRIVMMHHPLYTLKPVGDPLCVLDSKEYSQVNLRWLKSHRFPLRD